ncbi:MAG TPA: hypothetical protein VGK73_23855 [Polyangiaceae bacterium]
MSDRPFARLRRPVARLLALCTLVALAGCGGSSSSPKTPKLRGPRPAPSGSGLLIPALRATEIAKVPEGTFGPYVGESRDGALLVWASEDAGQQSPRGWHTLAVNIDGKPRGAARRVADAPNEVGLAVVRPNADGSQLAVVSTRRTALGEWVELTLINSDAELVMAPRQLAELTTRALWVEVLSLGSKRLVLWALPKDAAAEIHGITLGANGQPIGAATVLASGVRAWQAVPFAGGGALGTVRGEGVVNVLFIDKNAQVSPKPTAVSDKGRATLDFDLAPVQDGLVVAWSDQRDGESRVYRALIGADGNVRAPAAPLTAPLGEQALVRLVSRAGTGKAWALWESPAEREGDRRAFDVASIDRDGRTGDARGRIFLESEDAAVPEFAALSEGVAALTLASACQRDSDCSDSDVLPTFVRLGPTLEVQASEPLRLEVLKGNPAELGWGLSCGETHCFALAALGQTPAPVYVTELEKRSELWRPAARRLGQEAPPRVRENRVLATSEPLAAVALAPHAQGSLVGFITDFDPTTPWVKLKKPASDGRYEPLRARLSLLGVRPDGTALAPAQDLSIRAHSLGGIALAPGAPNGDLFAAWTGVDFGQPQVFLTLVGPDGARHSQRMLTRKSGDASDVAAAPVPKGWLVAWIDERDRDPELYVSRVDERLGRIGNEHRLTNAPGAATQVALAALGDQAVIAWADARDPDQPGEADIFLQRVQIRDASPIGGEQRVLATRGHSFAPVLRSHASGLLLAWLERGIAGTPGSGGLVFQDIDAKGAAAGEPLRVPIADGEPTALAVDCKASDCRVVLAVRSGDEAALYAGVLRADANSLSFKRLLTLGSRGSVGVPLAIAGDELVYADADAEGRWRVRRALLDWP